MKPQPGAHPKLPIVMLLALLLFAASPPISQAQTIVNNYTQLVNAINFANGNADATAINLNANITLTAALPPITTEVTIGTTGGIRTITGGGSSSDFSIFTVSGANGDLTLTNLTLTGGYAQDGGAIKVNTGASVELNKVTVSGNSAYRDGAGASGGGIHISSGNVVIRNSVISGNSATDTFTSGSGGGISIVTGGRLEIYDSVIRDNSANTLGGGINITTSASSADAITAIITNSVISGNNLNATATGGSGGGLFTRASSSTSGAIDLTISNSTVSGNSAAWANGQSKGGGLQISSAVSASISHSTIYGNISAGLGAFAAGLNVGSNINYANPSITLQNSLLAGNRKYTSDTASSPGGDCFVSNLLTSDSTGDAGGNLIQDGTCSPKVSGDPLVGALTTGTLPYHPLGANSPALEAAAQTHCATTDQVGNARPRPASTVCDIGAFESDLRPAPPPTAAFSCFQSGSSRNLACQSTSTAGAIHLWVITDSGNNEVARVQATTPSQRSIFELMPAYGAYTVTLTVTSGGDSHSSPRTIILSDAPPPPPRGSSGSSSSGASGSRAPTPTPQPRVHTGELLLAQGYGLSATHGLRSGVQFRRLDATGVGIGWVIDMGFLDALDVWGYVEQGVEICFPPERGSGGLMFLDAATSPRTASPLASELRNGYTCASINRPGTVVLVRNAPQPSQLPMPTALPTTMLSGCMVRTINVLNFRDAPAGNVVEPLIPFNVTLTAFERTAGWFKVDYHGARGWISAGFVEPIGACG